MLKLNEEYEIYQYLKENVTEEKDLNIVINCGNAVFGRLLSVCSKILKKYNKCTLYLTNIDNIIFKKDFVHYSSKIQRIINAGDKHKAPFVPTTGTKYIRYRFRNMVDKNKRFDMIKRFITWELPNNPDLEFSIAQKWTFKGFYYKNLMNQIRS